MHHQQILEHGGHAGVRSQSALEAALARPHQRWSDRELQSLPAVAAACAEAIVPAHPFADANKRTGFLVAMVFLGLNGCSFSASNESVVLTIQRLAAGDLAWPDLEGWFALHSGARP